MPRESALDTTGSYWSPERGQNYVGLYCSPLDALLLEKPTATFTEVVRAPDVVLAAVERKREAADLEASIDHVGG